MTIFGPDLSSFEAGVDVSALPDPFVMAKCTEGTYYADSQYAHWHQQAVSSGKVFVAYHFISGEDPAAQAHWMAEHIGDTSLPVMIDWEPEGNFKPTFPQLLALASALTRAGLRPKLAYAPRWHWQNEGSPDLSPLTALKIGVVASSYPGGTAYPGDTASGWLRYGNASPVLWQFTDHATDHGQYVGDYNAYRGTREELIADLGDAVPTSGGSTMGTIPESIGKKWPELAGDFPPNAPFTDQTALIWADGGARAAALYAQQARDAANNLNVMVTALKGAVDTWLATPAKGTDISALAAEIVAELTPHLVVGVDAGAIADAVEQRLAAALTRG
jgi:hypothetical protein